MTKSEIKILGYMIQGNDYTLRKQDKVEMRIAAQLVENGIAMAIQHSCQDLIKLRAKTFIGGFCGYSTNDLQGMIK
jgi:hypothetical protein